MQQVGEEHTETKIILVPIEAGFHGESEGGGERERERRVENVTSYGKRGRPVSELLPNNAVETENYRESSRDELV